MVRNRIFYLTAPPGVREFGTWCVTAGEARSMPGAQYPPDELSNPHRYRAVGDDGRVLDELQIVFGADGAGELEDERGEIRRIGRGDCFVILPGAWHRYHPDPGTGWQEYWVGVRGDAAERAVRLLEIDARGPVFSPVLDESLVETYERLLELASVHDTVAHVEMVALALRLIAVVARSGSRSDDDSAGADRIGLAIARM